MSSPEIDPKKPDAVLIQGLIWRLEESYGPKLVKVACCLVGFVVLACWFNFRANHGFYNSDAMESAQLGRHLAAWNGYTTDSIRPSALGMLQRAHPERATEVLQHPVPDLSIAPGYPFVLACLMKVLPFNFATDPLRPRFFQPESLIALFNYALFFASILLLFQVARRLFDSEVAWVSAIVLAGSGIYWKFCASGLSTIWLMVVFLCVTGCLAALEARENCGTPSTPGGSLALAAAAGALAGIGGLSRYSFAWMIIPVLLFLALFFKRNWGKMFALAAAAFLLVMAPWIARNAALSHTAFGTAGYALLENTRAFEEDRVERALDPFAAGLSHVSPVDIVKKFAGNEAKILRDDLPRLGGNWVWSFFLCSLLLPFQKNGLRRMRYFLVWSLALMAVVQALGQTHLTLESPEINSENLLVLMAPLVLVFGSGFFFTMLDQIRLPDPRLRGSVAAVFAGVMILPLLLDLTGVSEQAALPVSSPVRIQSTAAMLEPEELMMSDIPWAVAWYGDRRCVWLTLNDSGAFGEIDRLNAIHAVYLTQRTTDRPFLTEILDRQHSWERFVFDSMPESEWPRAELPEGFPLKKALLDYMPAQIFISDKVRWKTAAKK